MYPAILQDLQKHEGKRIMCPTSILQLETIEMYMKMPGFKQHYILLRLTGSSAHHLHPEVTYKMCIRVNANETSDGTDTHVSKK